MRNWIAALLATMVAGLALADDLATEMEKFGINPDVSYSGTQHIESREGKFDTFIRRAPQKMRMDINMGGNDMSVITREDLGVNYSLMPAMNMYRVVKADEMMTGANGLAFSEVSETGREVVSGYDCTKYRAKFTDAKGGRAGGYYWVSDDGILMKVDMIYQSSGRKGERMVLTLSDVKIGEQDPQYFELPSNYSKFGFNMSMGQPPGAQNSQSSSGNEDPSEDSGLGEAMGEAAKDEAEKTVVDETREKVRKGLRKLFGG